MNTSLRFSAILAILLFSGATSARTSGERSHGGIEYEDGVTLTQAQVDACHRAVESLSLPEHELSMACGAEGDNVGPGTTALRIAAGRSFSACVRGLQRLYRGASGSRGARIDRQIITCAYLNTAGRRVVASGNDAFESCMRPAVRAGLRPDSRVRRCVRQARLASGAPGGAAAGASYGYGTASERGEPPRARTSHTESVPASEPAEHAEPSGGGASAVETGKVEHGGATKRTPASRKSKH